MLSRAGWSLLPDSDPGALPPKSYQATVFMSDHSINSNGDGDIWSNPDNFFDAIGASLGSPFPRPKIVSAAEVRQEAADRSVNLLQNWDLLRGIIERHEPTIQRRWSKKSRQQRITLLLEEWPSMPPTHRPDFDAFRRETPEQQGVNTIYRDWYMFPYVNQEDLSKPKALLLFLNARARCHPSDFAGADGEAMHLGRVSQAIVPIFLNLHVMLLNGVTTPSEYGKLLHIYDCADAADWLYHRIQYLPGEGLLILEAQEKLLDFLVRCCQHILHDIPPSTLLSTEYPMRPESAMLAETEATGFDSLAAMASEAPYRSPVQIHFNRIISLLEARQSAAEDHLLSVREDPGYFVDQQLQLKEHRTEILKDTLGQPHPVFRMKGGHETFWSRVLGSSVGDAYLGLEIWCELLTQAQKLL